MLKKNHDLIVLQQVIINSFDEMYKNFLNNALKKLNLLILKK